MDGTIYTMYFSPTHTGQGIARAISGKLASELGAEAKEHDLTSPAAREEKYAFRKEDVLVFAFPVYGGRIPALLQAAVGNLTGDGTPAILAAVYGNRAFEDALLEASDLLAARGFVPVAGGAFIGEHSFSRKLAAGRPDAADLEAAGAFGQRAAAKLRAGDISAVAVSGNRPYKDAMPAMPFLPKTTDACTGCGICAKGCPMGVISAKDPEQVAPGCIQCCACVKGCPAGAKYFDAERIAQSTAMLEGNFMARKEPELFL